MRRGGGRTAREARGARSLGGRSARLGTALAALLISAGLLTACVPATATAGPRFVTPPLVRLTSVLWPIPLQLVGAEPGSRLRLSATLTTARGTWRSSATYTVPPTGTLDLATTRPQLAPYSRPDSAGLFWSLTGPALRGDELAEQWMRETLPVRLTAADGGRIVASRTFLLQGLAANLRPRTVTTAELSEGSPFALPEETHEDTAVGTFWSASALERPRTPVVLMFDDPSPGASSAFTAPLLAQLGAAVFVIPVGRSEDGVHLEEIVDALTVGEVIGWLDRHSGIDPGALFVYGTGPAEQLALWAADLFQSRVAGVFAAGGSGVLLCVAGTETPPVLVGGVSPGCAPRAPARPAAGLGLSSLAAVRGPVVLACGGRDEVLASACGWQEAIAATHPGRAGDTLVREPEAAHAVTVPPGLPIALPEGPGSAGVPDPGDADAQATERARVEFWNAVGQIILRAALS